MTWEQIIREYLKLFILVIETAGDQTSNSQYKAIQKTIDRNQECVQRVIDTGGIDFEIVVGLFCSMVILSIHGDRLVINDTNGEETMEKIKLSKELLEDLYQRYLKKPTEQFLRKNGLPPMADNITEVVESIFSKV